MGNQNNQWEYDYSDLYGSSGSGYPNAGSSGTNNANRCEQAETASAQPGEANAWAASGAQEPEYRSGGATGYGGSYYGSRSRGYTGHRRRCCSCCRCYGYYILFHD